MKKANEKEMPFSKEEIAAMKEYIKEKKQNAKGADAESQVLEKIAKMPTSDRALAKRLHALVKEVAPDLKSRLWYGMPAYTKEDKIILFFQDAAKFKARYATLGFSDKAHLDEGEMWSISFALKKLTGTEEAKIRALIKKAVS